MKPEEVDPYIDSCYSKAVDSSLNAGSKTQHVVADMGLDGKPTILGKKEFERAVAESESGTIYRGVTSTEHMSVNILATVCTATGRISPPNSPRPRVLPEIRSPSNLAWAKR